MTAAQCKINSGKKFMLGGVIVDVECIVATGVAFAAIRGDRRVVTWGAPSMGGDSSGVSRQLEDIVAVRGTVHAFAAINGGGDVVTWGHMKDSGRTTTRKTASGGSLLVSSWC
ncbi:hypothetical protein AK812_SmicGene19766 [Symbiodinium microadriaticum]|uniref:E3 ubiquitin-protein ligase HERC2 n=1 Tax=Symbiodinium microadriaticum TaxID=2951 RepID=A0A1Q9DRR1_SYMMI|nr:hypothetical protein AK812_SmicGene19766 [Symbiodinium microadriaticum]